MNGCASPPSPVEIQDQTDDFIATINRLMDEAVVRCNGDQGCVDAVNERRNILIDGALETRRKAMEENWKDARERRRQLEKELYEMLPDFPDLKPAIDLIFGDTWSSDTSFLFDVNGTPVQIFQFADQSGNSSSGVSMMNPSTKLRFTGPTTVTIAGSSLAGNLAFDIFVTESIDQNGSYQAAIQSGSGTWTSGSLDAQFTIAVLGKNEIAIPNGSPGIITILLDIDYNSDAWASVLPRYQTFHIPITRTGDQFEITDQPVGLFDNAPHIEHPASDYNRDGLLDLATDSAAYLQGLLALVRIADMKHVGSWDAQDHTIWTTVVQADLAARGTP